jgi:hypothetical protein
VVIDATASKEIVADAIWQMVQLRLQLPATRRLDEAASAKA